MKYKAYPYAWTENSNGDKIGDLIWMKISELEKVKQQLVVSGKIKRKSSSSDRILPTKQNMLFRCSSQTDLQKHNAGGNEINSTRAK